MHSFFQPLFFDIISRFALLGYSTPIPLLPRVFSTVIGRLRRGRNENVPCMPLLFHYFYFHWNTPVQDLDLAIRGGGGRASPKKMFSALRVSVWSKNNGGGGGGGVLQAPPLDLPLYLVGASEEERHPRRPRGSKSGREKRRDKILKTFGPPFLLTRLTAPGPPRMERRGKLLCIL